MVFYLPFGSDKPFSRFVVTATLSALALKTKIWELFIIYARWSLLSAIQRGVTHGSLTIHEDDKTLHFGEKLGSKKQRMPAAVIRVQNPNFWIRLYAAYDLGFAEAYMHGDFTGSPEDAKAILDLWLVNRHNLNSLSSIVSWSASKLSALYIMALGQSLSNARLNVITGYDVSNEFFYKLLGETMQYSCAIWPEHTGGVRGDLDGTWSAGDLDAAQLYKIHSVLRQARVRRGDRVLEIGTGWGSLAIEAAKIGCTVDTLTLSVEQKAWAEGRIRRAGLQDRITVHLLDYRELPPHFEHKFDAFISIEMVEHAGAKWLPTYFKMIDWALKQERGAAVITATSMPDWRFSEYQSVDYARRYQWPNAFIPSPTYLAMTADKAWRGKMCLESIEDHTHHYPRTLREWGRRLQSHWGSETIKNLVERHPNGLNDPHALGIFKRKWEYMCIYAEAGFARAYASCHQWTFVRPENIVMRCD
ncbi:cyclopropane-fatty-acyl-phospholipid synthase [Cytidiella melzeri]|nr:cyclopropane-fatty-acyl-phospholipid synthase [Cytidiella melzeri]